MAVSASSLNIVAVFQRYTHLSPASHSGKQWQGACPFSDCSADTDGFVVWPELTSRGCHYYCRGCGRAGDVLSFVCAYEGISRRRGCDVLGIPYDETTSLDELVLPKMAPDDPPPDAWQQRATAFAQEAMERLWSDEGLLARDYLHQRGLTDEIIQQAQLGYHKTTCVEPAATWGIADRPQIEKVWLPRGIVIPWFAEHGLWKLNIRRGDKDIEHDIQQAKAYGRKPRAPKYVEVQGSANYLYHVDALVPGHPALLLESELDALAAIQAGTHDIVSAVATGSIGRGHTPRALCALAQASRVLIGFDVDANGRGDDAAAWWLRTLPHATRLRPWVHDVNEMLQQQQDIRTWVALGLEMPIQSVAIELKEEQQDEAIDRHSIQAQEEEPSLICSICSAEVEYYSPEGIAYCMQHWTERDATEPPMPLTPAQEIMELARQWDEGHPAQMVIDLETTGLDQRQNKVITIAFGVPEKVTIIDTRSYYSADLASQQEWRGALQRLLQRDTILWIGHNLKFDWSFLAHHFGVKLDHVYDTMLVEKLLHVGSRVSASLLASAERYGIAVTKEQRSWFIDLDTRPAEWIAPLPDAQLTYIRQDIEVPYQLYECQQEAIAQHDLARVVTLEQQALPAIAAMEVRGVCVDGERWRSILAAKHEQKVAREKQLQRILGEALAHARPAQETLFGEKRLPTVNLGSSQQLIEALHALGIHVTSISKEALQEAQQPHEVIPLLLEWKVLEKFETAFGKNLLSYVTHEGRIHATFDQLGAASGRVICREPNLQQIPKPTDKDDPYDLRRCFVAPDGYKLLIADLSNIELRILAEVSGDATMLRFFAEGKDLHSETARLMFKLSPDIDPKAYLVNGKKARDIAKTINFGLAYGMGAQGLANRVGVDLATAKRLMQTYFATYKAVAAYLARSGKEGIARGYAVSLSGRKRFFSQDELKAKRGEAERSAKNHPIQGTNADILKCALGLLYHQLPIGVYVVLTVHDEIVLECPDGLVEEATRVLKDAMVQACREYLKVVCVPEPEVLEGSYWKKD
jgi:DNA polymerase-1